MPADFFIRVHRTHLVNKDFISSYKREGILYLKDGSSVEVSRRKKDQVMRFMND